ncbi:MAG TPA: efflux RND transporter permease subunit [Pirellulales bacterium]|nr:efflux RND transporter permease subunit [Pirellulales bacterium]
MKGLIRASLNNPHAVIVFSLTVLVLGGLTLRRIPIDILPVFKSPAVQVLTFYGGMPAQGIEKDITNRMERWTGQANGMKRQESRSIIGASIVRNYFQDGVEPNGALTEVNSLALAVIPNLPPGTLPPVVLPFDPTSTVPVCLVALDSRKENESILYDVGRYEVRNMIMSTPGASAPVVFGGKLRAVMLYLDRIAMQARGLSPVDVMHSVDESNVFVPSGDVRINGLDLALLSNSMFEQVGGSRGMGGIPLSAQKGNAQYLQDVAVPKDAAFIQTNVVRVNGRRQVYIPVYRQLGASTLTVVEGLKAALPKMQGRLSRPDIELKMVMDQSVYVRSSIWSLVQEGGLGAILCSLVILLFLAEWRMTVIAVATLPLAVFAAVVCLYYTDNTINVMTLGGLALAIGPMVDSAIICLENTHRHLSEGKDSKEAAFLGASEVAMPELVATLCTFLVLAPLALMPGMGQFLFRPMTLAVAFAMISAYLLSRTVVPSFSSLFLGHSMGEAEEKADAGRKPAYGLLSRALGGWLAVIDRGLEIYKRALNVVLRHRLATIACGFVPLILIVVLLGPRLRRDFFPEVDAGAFEVFVRLPTGAEIDRTEKKIELVEEFLRRQIADDLELIVSELGVTPDWSAAYTPNAGTMDAVVKVQLTSKRRHSAQEHVRNLRRGFASEKQFSDLEFAFDAGGMVRGALNEGKSSPLTARITSNDQAIAEQLAQQIKQRVSQIDGIVDARVLERMDAPALVVDVDRAKAADLGLTQQDVMQNVIASTNSSITFNKKNFWIDPVSHNQYFVGVQYPETGIASVDDVLNIPITGRGQHRQVTLGELATVKSRQIPAELTHIDIQPTVHLAMAVEGRDLGHVAVDVARALDQFGQRETDGTWLPYAPGSKGPERKAVPGAQIALSGEYSRMQEAFANLGAGLILSSLLIYFLMVALARSFVVPLAVMLVVPLSLVGVLPMLYLTGSALDVQSLLGIIFIVGISVSNTVLMTDWAQELRKGQGLSPTEAIREAAAVRARPVMMTAMAAFCAMLPTALALERGSEANAPLARAILGGLLAAEPATLFVLPAIYSLLVRERSKRRQPAAD